MAQPPSLRLLLIAAATAFMLSACSGGSNDTASPAPNSLGTTGKTAIKNGAPVITTPSGNSIGTKKLGKKFLGRFKADSSTPVTWSATGNLPPGVRVNENGYVGGIPTRAGTYTFKVHAKNGVDTTSKDIKINVVK